MSDKQSGFNSAGPFSGDNAGGLKSGIAAAMQVMGKNDNMQDHTPTQATPEVLDAVALDIRQNARTLQDKNNIVKNHYQKLGLEDGEKTTQSIAAFERAVMKKVGR